MSRDLSLIKLRRVEAGLRKTLAKAAFIGQLSGAREHYARLSAEVSSLLAGRAAHLTDVPDAVLLALMVFCARYEDTAAEGFWATFLRSLGLANEPRLQAACRERFKGARDGLSRSYGHLHFPAEGYACVTPILYHAIIPQACVPEMAALLGGIGQDAGWEAVVEMELEQLEAQLPLITQRARATKPLVRFVTGAHSRRLAARLLHDLCDAAYLHQRGELSAEQIEFLLSDHPVQREIWERMIDAPEPPVRTARPHSLLAAPRWQWDLRARQLRLFFPRQTCSGNQCPTMLVIKKERYPVQAQRAGDGWQIEPLSIANLPLAWPEPSHFTVELRAEDNQRLRHWQVAPPKDGALFFQLNSSGTVANYLAAEKGLPPSETLVLLRRNLLLNDDNGAVQPSYRERAPQGFEAEYEALAVWLQPPVTIFARGDDEEPLRRFTLLAESVTWLTLQGELLKEADDPSGTAVYCGLAPDLCVPAQSFAEVKNLQLQLRELTAAEGAVAELRSIQSLLDAEIAAWSEPEHALRIHLSSLLLDRRGRFRVKLLHGLQSARYAPVEFIVTPEVRITPSADELDNKLFSLAEPPQVQVACPEAVGLHSDGGQVGAVLPGVYRVAWSPHIDDFTAALDFGHYRVPLRWRLHVLRARALSRGVAERWAEAPLNLPFDDLSFAHVIEVEGIENASYQIFAGEVAVAHGKLSAARLQMPLLNCKDAARASASAVVPIRLMVRQRGHEHQLLLAQLFKKAAQRNGRHAGELIAHLRLGQRVFHPDYGVGVLETFQAEWLDGAYVNLARFHFQRHEGVQIYIPASRYLPLYSQHFTSAINNLSRGALL